MPGDIAMCGGHGWGVAWASTKSYNRLDASETTLNNASTSAAISLVHHNDYGMCWGA